MRTHKHIKKLVVSEQVAEASEQTLRGFQVVRCTRPCWCGTDGSGGLRRCVMSDHGALSGWRFQE